LTGNVDNHADQDDRREGKPPAAKPLSWQGHRAEGLQSDIHANKREDSEPRHLPPEGRTAERRAEIGPDRAKRQEADEFDDG
jgi:hypothetical protein